jgi:hypothetical protein
MNARQRRTSERAEMGDLRKIHICEHCFLVMMRSYRHAHDCKRDHQRLLDDGADFMGPREPDIVF